MSAFSRRTAGWISIVMVLVLLVMTGCSNGQAVPKSRIQAQDAAVRLKPDLEESPTKRPKERQELVSKRTRYSTRFVNPDGTFTEEIYMEPQFFQDLKDKQWKKIDNTLKVNKNRVENAANNLRVALAETAGTDAVLRMALDNKSVSFLPVGASKIKAQVKDNTLTYKGLFPNVDATYLVQGGSVKENLVLRKAGAPNTFSYELLTEGVMPFAEKDGTISFLNEENNEAVWNVPRPFLYDAAGKTSGAVTLKLRREGERQFLDLAVDPAFLKAETTKYPVTIDPTYNNWDVIRDTFVSSATPTTSYASSPSLFVGTTPAYGTTRSLLQFSLRSLPSDSVINSASLNVYNTTAGTADSVVDLYRVTGNATTSATWGTQPATGATAESTVTSNATNAYWTWYVTRLVKDWYNGIQANNGVQLRMRTETAAARSFTSVNSGTNTPRLTIDYTLDPIGLEPYWGYTKDTVNVSNGNLVITETDITTPGRGPEVKVTRVHNSRAAGQAGMFGYGWFSNLESVVWDAGVGPATLLDEDRTRHIFGQDAAGNFEAAPDVKLQLVKNADGTYTVTKPDGTVVTYNARGRITTITDTAGNVVRFNYDASNRLASIADATGRLTTFAYGANGYVSSVTAPGNHTTTYAYDTAGNLTTVTDPSGTPATYVYDASRRVTQTKMHNATTNVTYDASNRCATVSKPVTVSGAVQTSTTTIAYDPAASTTTVTAPDGRTSIYTYNTVLNLVSTVDDAGTPTESVTTYGYDPDRNLTSLVDPLSHQAALKDPLNETNNRGYVVTYQNGNPTNTQLPSGATASIRYDENGNPISNTDFENNTYQTYYNQGDLATDVEDPLKQTSSTRYGTGGLLQYASNPIAAAENFAVNSSFETDANGDGWADNWSRQNESGKTASFAWVNGGRFGKKSISISNPSGWAVVNNEMIPYATDERYAISGYVKTANLTGPAYVRMEYYDASSRWLGEQRSSPIRGTQDWTRLQALVIKPPAGTAKMRPSVFVTAGTGTATFDAIQVERGHVISTYNLLDNSGMERDADGNNLPDFWDSSGNLVSGDGLIKTPDPATVRIGSSSFRLTGEAGKQKFLVQRINLSGDESTPFTLSGWSRQTGANPNGGTYGLQVGLHPAGGGNMNWSNANSFSRVNGDWQFVAARVAPTLAFDYIEVYLQYYDQTGSAIFDGVRLQPGNAITFYEYDPTGNYQRKEISPSGYTTVNEYDVRGNLLSVTDPMIRVTKYAYNARDKITQVTDPAGNSIKTSYNPAGLVSAVTDARNGTTSFGYNEFFQLASKKDPLNNTVTYDYDKLGNRTKQVNPNGSVITRGYTGDLMTSVAFNGQPVHTITYNVNHAPATATDSAGRQTTYEYNANGLNYRHIKGPVTVEYGYDDNNRLNAYTVAGTTTSQISYAYNPVDLIQSIARNGVLHTNYVYNENGSMTTIQRGNGLFTTFAYNDDQHLQYQREYNANGDLLTAYELDYTETGNISTVTTHQGTKQYLYNGADELTYELLPDGTQINYTFDANGNRTKRTVGKGGVISSTTTYTYDAANQLTSVNGSPYTYDANGNMTGGGGVSYVYDADDRLIAVKNAAGATLASFTYDHLGVRTSSTTAAGTVYYHYNNAKPQRLVAETDASGKILAEYSWDQNGRPATMTRNGYTYYYHYNGHGDVLLLTDAAGNTVAQYQYDAWGTITSQSGALAAANPFRYAGYQYDEATGLYYLLSRYYATTLGRFLTRDREVVHLSTPAQSNPYLYAGNNPLRYEDETGKSPQLLGPVSAGYKWAATWGYNCGIYRTGVSCKDYADSCCYRHDRCYSARTRNSCSCDKEMISCMRSNMYRMKASEKSFAERAIWLFERLPCSKKRATVRVTASCTPKR